MTKTITIELSDELADRLQPVADNLPSILELGLREFHSTGLPEFEGAVQIFEFLAGLPEPEQILKLRPSAAMQERVQILVNKSKTEGLNPLEERSWQQYEFIEHLVRLAKIKALASLQETSR